MGVKYINGIGDIPRTDGNVIIFTFDDGPRDMILPNDPYQRDERYPASAKHNSADPYPETYEPIINSNDTTTYADALMLRLQQYSAHASMFCIGWRLKAAKERIVPPGSTHLQKNWVTKWLNAGHDVCNHTYHHPNNWDSIFPVRAGTDAPNRFSAEKIAGLTPPEIERTFTDWSLQVREMDGRMNDIVGGVERFRRFSRTPHYDGMIDRVSGNPPKRPSDNNKGLIEALSYPSKYLNYQYLVSDRFLVGDDQDNAGVPETVKAFRFGFNYLHNRPDTHEKDPDAAHGAIVLLHERVDTIRALNRIMSELTTQRLTAGNDAQGNFWEAHNKYKIISLEQAFAMGGQAYRNGNIRKSATPEITLPITFV